MLVALFQQFNHRFPRLSRFAGSMAYPVFVGVVVLLVARLYYGQMLRETGGEWSAPLDDVYIHFDYARAIARGYPFQWSEGNGYSSGNTSLTYPFVLAAGYWAGFRGMLLMQWAAIVACTSMFGFLLMMPRLVLHLPRGVKYMLPVAVFSVGALNWTLFSGMEVAWFLVLWGVGLVLCLRFDEAGVVQRSSFRAMGWQLGVAGMLLVATRPEASTSIAVFGLAAGWFVFKAPGDLDRRGRVRAAIGTIIRAGTPAILLLLVQALVNRVLTGEAAASGALVKLVWYHPYESLDQKWGNYLFNLGYVFVRNFHYHFSAIPPTGWLVLPLCIVAVACKKTRKSAIILMSSCLSFLVLVAMNGQVRWQNERYTMPAVTWLLLTCALGVAALVMRPSKPVKKVRRIGRLAVAILCVGAFGIGQCSRFIDQVWFFGRACRNIRDQQITVGRMLRYQVKPTPKRVLVGDAGAITYASDLPGLDIIGLGGYHRMPFDNASRYGVGAIIELIERIPPNQRPDIMAIYPTWWDELPIFFGKHITSVWTEGNVICGAVEKGIYAANWRLLNTGDRPATLADGEQIVDALDVADVVSEARHRYRFPSPHAGFVKMRVLADPLDPKIDVLDSGRVIPPNTSDSFVLRSEMEASSMRLVVRCAPVEKGHIDVFVDDVQVGTLITEPVQSWAELQVPLPKPLSAGAEAKIRLFNRDMFHWSHFHVWLVGSP